MGLCVRGLTFYFPLVYLCMGLATLPIFINRPLNEGGSYNMVILLGLPIKIPKCSLYSRRYDLK